MRQSRRDTRWFIIGAALLSLTGCAMQQPEPRVILHATVFQTEPTQLTMAQILSAADHPTRYHSAEQRVAKRVEPGVWRVDDLALLLRHIDAVVGADVLRTPAMVTQAGQPVELPMSPVQLHPNVSDGEIDYTAVVTPILRRNSIVLEISLQQRTLGAPGSPPPAEANKTVDLRITLRSGQAVLLVAPNPPPDWPNLSVILKATVLRE